jgi:hypothetical protein
MIKMITAMVAVLVIFAGVAQAQAQLPDPGTLPDSAFYGISRAFESIGNAFTFGERGKTERAITLSERRLAEADAVALKGKPEHIARPTEDYQKHIERANNIARSARDANVREELLLKVGEATLSHIETLDEVEQRVPEEAKARIAAARERSIRGNQEALRALARENPQKSAELAMQAAEGRVNSARAAAQRGDESLALKAVQEYQRYSGFGEEISAIAVQVGKDHSKVNELVALATSRHITVLEEVMLRLPGEAAQRMESALEAARNGRDMAVEAMEDNGMLVPEEIREQQRLQNNAPPVIPARP